MHVIAKPALIEFWEKHPDAESPLQAWFRTMENETFVDFNELRATFASADYVDGLTVFNIGGNKYRLVVEMQYRAGIAWVKFIGTHTCYDEIDVETINDY